MLICKVTGSVVATRKYESLVGQKFMVVAPLNAPARQPKIVAVDNIGAGIGEIVLVVFGTAARLACGSEQTPVDAAIVGIVDDQ